MKGLLAYLFGGMRSQFWCWRNWCGGDLVGDDFPLEMVVGGDRRVLRGGKLAVKAKEKEWAKIFGES